MWPSERDQRSGWLFLKSTKSSRQQSLHMMPIYLLFITHRAQYLHWTELFTGEKTLVTMSLTKILASCVTGVLPKLDVISSCIPLCPDIPLPGHYSTKPLSLVSPSLEYHFNASLGVNLLPYWLIPLLGRWWHWNMAHVIIQSKVNAEGGGTMQVVPWWMRNSSTMVETETCRHDLCGKFYWGGS